MTHTEMTKHIRTCVKRYGIKARVSKQTVCGDKIISICVPSYGDKFTPEEIRNFCQAARSNNLTLVMGLEIKPEEQAMLTDKDQWNFVF